MNIRPIATEADYEEALAEIRRLWSAEPGTDARNTLEVLAMLAHHCERAGEPLPNLSAIDAIKFRMEQQVLTRKDLLPIFGTTGRISEILTGKRSLNLEMIRKLHATFDIPLEVLVRAPPRASSRARRPTKRKPVAKRLSRTRSPSPSRV